MLAGVLAFGIPLEALAQAQAQAQAPVRSPESAPVAIGVDQPLSAAGQLDALLAPIALYPDALLAQILMASTYPLEIVQAERWLASNKNNKENLTDADLRSQSWDDSVKALVSTPSVLEMMSKNLECQGMIRKLHQSLQFYSGLALTLGRRVGQANLVRNSASIVGEVAARKPRRRMRVWLAQAHPHA
ncbi:DUF3300 domain-containing protein [Bosea sp. Leaf344]|uniref:DUF3300 domain-containing protein n=1 Tax=Bosea sp. Leaf344 TaxID=1736346 RepID=UPI001FCDED8A|nr:DUF3300 domain-containing protein [Bosea sp. Leaf344]